MLPLTLQLVFLLPRRSEIKELAVLLSGAEFHWWENVKTCQYYTTMGGTGPLRECRISLFAVPKTRTIAHFCFRKTLWPSFRSGNERGKFRRLLECFSVCASSFYVEDAIQYFLSFIPTQITEDSAGSKPWRIMKKMYRTEIIAQEITSCYQSLFTSSDPSPADEVLQNLPCSITSSMNLRLIRWHTFRRRCSRVVEHLFCI